MTFSFVWTVAILLFGVLVSRNLKQMFLFQISFLFILEFGGITSTALFIGKQELNCSDLPLAAAAITSIACLIRGGEVDRHIMHRVSALVVLLLCCVAFNMVLPYEGVTVGTSGSWDNFYFGFEPMTHVGLSLHSILILLRLSIWLLLLCAAGKLLKETDYLLIARRTIAFNKIQIIWGVLEFISKNLFASTVMTSIALKVFPAASSVYTELNIRGGLASLQGFTREPSHFALALFFFLMIELLLFRKGEYRRKDSGWCAIAGVLLIVSGAFTAIVGIAILIFYAILLLWERKQELWRHDRKLKLAVIIGAVAVCAAVLIGGPYLMRHLGGSYYISKLQNVLMNLKPLLERDYANLGGVSDALPRMISIVDCLYVFFSRPLFGVGPGVVNPFSGVVATLANYGLLVTIAWGSLVRCYSEKFSQKTGSWLFLLFVVMTGLIMLDGSFTYSVYWILFAGLFGGKKDSSGQLGTGTLMAAAGVRE